MNEHRSDFQSLGFPEKNMYHFPNIINLEVYRSSCPCRCLHCPVGLTNPSERLKRFGSNCLNLDLYKKIVNEIAEHSTSTLRIHSVGEPLLWDDIIPALAFAKKKNVKTWIFTCAVTNNMDLLEAVCSNVNILEISVNSTNTDDYKKTKGIDAFRKVTKNIEYLQNIILNKNLNTRLIVSRVQSLNEKDDKYFVDQWKAAGLVADAFVRSFHSYNDLIGNQFVSEKRHEPCRVHWARFNISLNGSAVICFNELFKKNIHPSLILGDLNTQTIAEIWHGKKLKEIRKAELNLDYSNLTLSDSLPCKDCNFCQPLFNNQPTSETQINKI